MQVRNPAELYNVCCKHYYKQAWWLLLLLVVGLLLNFAPMTYCVSTVLRLI